MTADDAKQNHGEHDHCAGAVGSESGGQADPRRSGWQERSASLSKGDGAGKVLFLDAFNGVSGDMLVSALLGLGASWDAVCQTIRALPISGFSLHHDVRSRGGIVGTSFEVRIEESQPERCWSEIDAMLSSADLPERVKQGSRRVFGILAEAEARVHGVPPGSVHFHEIGAVDSIVDIVAASTLIAWIDPSEIVCSPLPMGHGTVQTRHGLLPLPAPATIECLHGVPTYGVDVEGELVTPTGAALVKGLANGFATWPSLVPERVGVGTGARNYIDRPNLIRAVLGSRYSAGSAPDETTHVVVETNVDDMTGELVAHVLARLLAQGARDAWASPMTTKKGRPGLVISVLALREQADAIEHALLSETTSIGVRRYGVTRSIRPRHTVVVETHYGPVPMKVSGGQFGPEQVKPEFEVCEKLAAEQGIPVRAIVADALASYSRRAGSR